MVKYGLRNSLLEPALFKLQCFYFYIHKGYLQADNILRNHNYFKLYFFYIKI